MARSLTTAPVAPAGGRVVEPVRHVTVDELAGEPAGVLDAVRQGTVVLVERQGKDEAALLDIVDYRILRAAIRYLSEPPRIADPEAGLVDVAVARIEEPQARFDLVIGYYLAGALSTSRMAALLGTTFIDMSVRFHRLGLPFRVGFETVEELRAEVEEMDRWSAARQ